MGKAHKPKAKAKGEQGEEGFFVPGGNVTHSFRLQLKEESSAAR